LPPSCGPGQGEAIAVLGRIITASVARVRDIDADEYWLIARAGPDVPPLVRHAELAPSEALFRTYLAQWRGCPGEQWWPQYSSAFSREMETEEKVGHRFSGRLTPSPRPPLPTASPVMSHPGPAYQ